MTPADPAARGSLRDGFENLDVIPGSRTARRPADDPAFMRARQRAEWDANPLIRYQHGVPCEFFFLRHLGLALGRPGATIRRWEEQGFFPSAPYRLRSKRAANGDRLLGERVYTRLMVESAVEAFEVRGLLGAKRLDWSGLGDFSLELRDLFSEIKRVEASRDYAPTPTQLVASMISSEHKGLPDRFRSASVGRATRRSGLNAQRSSVPPKYRKRAGT